VLAVPVAPSETLQGLRSEVDNIVCLTDLEPWGAIGYFYDDFRQLTDENVKETLALFRQQAGPQK
jgi:predicted phosphoribosyltransferase